MRESPFIERLRLDIHPLFDAAIRVALFQQIPVLLLSLLLLDFFWTLRICSIAAAVQWAAITIVAVRRGSTPTAFDLAIVKYAYFPLILLVWLIAGVMAWV